MAKSQTKNDNAAEQADAKAAETSAGDSIDLEAVADAIEADHSAPLKAEAIAVAVAEQKPKTAKTTKAKIAPGKKAAKPAEPAADAAPVKQASTRKSAPAKAQTPPTSTSIKPKEPTMAQFNQNNAEQIADTTEGLANDIQSRLTSSYQKGTEMTSEAVEFQKGNVEALVESSRILVSGMQDMGRTYVEEARTAAEALQGDVKKMAAIKSPTELFQLQGEIARRNFDSMVATASKNTEAMIKLANEAFAPMSNRMSLAAEKVSKVA